MDLAAKRRIKKYTSQSIHYFENADYFINASDLEKASEFLWGSMTQALKAVAASKGIQIRSHRQLRDYAMELARALPDDNIRHAFDKAQSLHSNFYESGLLLEDVVIAADDIRAGVRKLLGLIPQAENKG